jgi:segregation and condensation protein B
MKTIPMALTQAGLESLAIIAYKQPVVRGEIEKIRGVDSGGVLRTLLERKLIRILGKKDVPGKPLVYGTSRQFLEMFGLKDLSSLPTLKDMEGLGPSPGDEPLPLATPTEGEAKEMDSGRTDLPPDRKIEEDEPPAKNSEDFI